MRSISLNFLLSLLIFHTLSVTYAQYFKLCPDPPSLIAPCLCSNDPIFKDQINVLCNGPSINQSIINTAILQLNVTNEGSPLIFKSFTLSNTTLTSIDLTPFARYEINQFYIQDNPTLSVVVPPTTFTSDDELNVITISANQLEFESCNLTDEGAATLLQIFDPTRLALLFLHNNALEGVEPSIIRGLSTFTRIRYLRLNKNKIKIPIEGGQFKNMARLSGLYLNDNNIPKLGANAFLFGEWDDFTQTEPLDIDLRGNKFTLDDIDIKHQLDNTTRNTTVDLSDNQLEYLDEGKFKNFFFTIDETDQDGRTNNSLTVWDNPFICDTRMRWLRDAPELEDDVKGIYCMNFPGKTIFSPGIDLDPKSTTEGRGRMIEVSLLLIVGLVMLVTLHY